MKLTLISDTHNKHKKVTDDITEGHVLIHTGDISSMGYTNEVKSFLEWFSSVGYFEHRIFIAGNHDYLFEQDRNLAKELLKEYPMITYLEDESVKIWDETYENEVKIYGAPWQPFFHNWAFNIKRDSDEIEEKWNQIPDDTDILLTHGPVHKILDRTEHWNKNVGCERLQKVIFQKSPKMHVCGHVHEARGWAKKLDIHFFNASVLDLQYNYVNKPFNIDWEPETNTVEFL